MIKFAQDANSIPVYSTKIPHGSWPLWVFVGFIVGTFVIALSLTAYETSRGPNFRLRKVLAAMIIAFLPVSMALLIIATSPSPAYEHYASYMADHQGRSGKDFDFKREDVDKAVAAKYGVSSVESGDNYKAKDGTIYHDCQVNFTNVVNKHISIESMNCAKGENLTPVAAKR